jgi:tetratricopeptide (TPR) repeat protein
VAGVKPRRLTAAAVFVAALAATSVASADVAEDRAAARQHLTQAQDLKKQGNLAEALGHFQESQRLDPKLATLLDLADCAEQLGKLVEAQGYWAAGRDQAKKDEKPQSRARAEQRLAAVEKRVAHFTLQLSADAPAGTQVFHDDVLVDAAALGTSVAANPGDHAVVVKASGHQDAKYALKQKATTRRCRSRPVLRSWSRRLHLRRRPPSRWCELRRRTSRLARARDSARSG